MTSDEKQNVLKDMVKDVIDQILPSGEVELTDIKEEIWQDLSALYYNPANLADAVPGVMGGFFMSLYGLDIGLYDRSPLADVTEGVLDEPVVEGGRLPSVPTATLLNPRADTENRDIGLGLQLGLAHDLTLKWLMVGAALLYDDAANPSGLVMTLSDVTLRMFAW